MTTRDPGEERKRDNSRGWPVILLLAALALTACDRGGTTSIPEKKAEQPAAPASAANDSLAVVLTPHRGESETDKRIVELQERVRLSPAQGPYLERLGWAFVEKARISGDAGFYTLAEQAARALDQAAPGDPAGLLLLGHVRHTQHRFAEAEEIGRRLTGLREAPFDHALLGDALMEQGKLEEAVAVYQKMVDLRPGLQTYSRVAHLRWLKGDLEGALALMREAVNAGGAGAKEATAWALTRRAGYEWQSGMLPEARASVQAALEFVPGYAPALLMEGRILLGAGRAGEAVRPLQEAAKLSPLPEYLWTLSEALRASDRATEAQSVEDELQKRGGDDARTYSLFLATRGSNPARALALAEAELRERQDVFTRDALAWSLYSNGRPQEARAEMEKALREGTRDGRLFLHAAVIAASMQETAVAERHLAEARLFAPMLLPSEQKALEDLAASLSSGYSQISNQPTNERKDNR